MAKKKETAPKQSVPPKLKSFDGYCRTCEAKLESEFPIRFCSFCGKPNVNVNWNRRAMSFCLPNDLERFTREVINGNWKSY